MHRHPFHHHHFGGDAVRHELPLGEHPRLEVESDFTLICLTPIKAGERPFVEIVGRAPLPTPTITGEGGTTRVGIDVIGHTFEDLGFWDRRRWKKQFGAKVVFHVPENVQARIRPAAAAVHIEGLTGCDLDIQATAGAIFLERVAGKLALGTEAGRIDGVGISGSIQASTTAGAIRLELLALAPGRHKVHTSMGAAVIELARGMPVQIDTRTTMGSSRVEATSTRGASSVLEVEADLGAIRVFSSRQAWVAPAPAPATSPYRDAPDDTMERILARVADGSLSPRDARELLRSMGWS
jgi:hypothetical protein